MRAIVGAILLMAAPPAVAQVTSAPAETTAPGAAARPVAFTRVGAVFRDDQRIGTYKWGVICVEQLPVYWSDLTPSLTGLKDIFGAELKAQGLRPDLDPGNLFADTQNAATDLQVGAMIKTADVRYCDDAVKVAGKLTMGIEWQVYSSLRREVVATIQTVETAEWIKRIGGKEPQQSLGYMAFAANVRALANSEQFRALVTAPDVAPPGVAETAGRLSPIPLVTVAKGPIELEQATGSVVAVFAGSGHGSGVLVSDEGYILTNHHVVGTASTVRVRWSDGFETQGEVVRSDKRRDVALVRTEPRGRSALPVSRRPLKVGAQVYAVGAPLDPKLQGTVTRGVVSANRILDGYNFIQSDTPVTNGNSGGPLLDEQGVIVGLTNMGIPPERGSSLNFFIPIGDALDFLALRPGG